MPEKNLLLLLLFSTLFVVVLFAILEKNFKDIPRFQGKKTLASSDSQKAVHGFDKKLLDLEDFEYTIVPSDCNASLFAWIVTSYAGDVSSRSALRRAYPAAQLATFGIRRVFLLAMLDNSAQQRSQVSQNAIYNEAQRFEDIVQGNFMEAYRNLTYKHVMGLKWAVENCNGVPYIMKMDHDIVLNLYAVVDLLKRKNNTIPELGLVGYVLRDMPPVREPANKWFVTQAEFGLATYPDFLSGWLYITTPNTVRKLVDRAQSWPSYFWIDDVFVTGIIRQDLDIAMVDIHSMYTTDSRHLTCCLKDKVKKLKCDFAVGPNGGDAELQVRFGEFAEFCELHCSARTEEFSIRNTCLVSWHAPSLGMGRAVVDVIS